MSLGLKVDSRVAIKMHQSPMGQSITLTRGVMAGL